MNQFEYLFDELRVNEYDPRLIGIGAINPWLNHISSPRVQMLNSQLQQVLDVADATDRRCFVGLESKFGEHTFGIRVPKECDVLRIIPRFANRIGDDQIPHNPTSYVIVEYDKKTSSGLNVRELDCIELPSYQVMHQNFGRKYRYLYSEKDLENQPRLQDDEPIAVSPSISENGSYRFGMETNVAMMSIPQVIEDGVVASKSFCERAKTTGVATYEISFGKRDIPLNIYGDFDQYKIFPEIGEKVRDDGVIMALRRHDDLFAPGSQSYAHLQQPDSKYDRLFYSTPGAEVIDVRVQHDARYMNATSRSKINPNTPIGVADQADKYWRADVRFYRTILDIYRRYRNNNPDLHISRRFHRLIVEAMAMTSIGPNEPRIAMTHRDEEIDEWRVVITVKHTITPTHAFKISGLHGDKGVIVDVWDDEDMPVDEDGNRAELIVDGVSTIKRMNVSRVIEQYINACSRDVSKRIVKMHNDGEDRRSIEEYLLGYYKIVSPKMVDMVTDSRGRVLDNHYQQVLSDGIYLFIPNDNEPETMDIIDQLRRYYPPTFGPVYYRGDSGVHKWTKRPILIGSMYIMLLEKIGRNWAGVSVSKLNHFGIPSKLTNFDRNSAPARQQPIRFGESEARHFAAHVGGEQTSRLLDRSNNPVVRKQLIETILRSDKPTSITKIIDREQYPAGNGRILSLSRHLSECAGFRFRIGTKE